MASLTCSACRHVVEVADGASGKCENCGAEVRPPPPPFTTASAAMPRRPISPAPLTESVTPASAAFHASPPGLVAEPTPIKVRAASIVCLVCGLVFFVPFVTQAVGMVAGAIAILRRRLTNERVAAAWVGITLCALGLIGWTAAISALRSMKGTGLFSMPTAMPAVDNEWSKPGDWKTELETVYRAASAYHRDFNRWPASIDDLGGHSLRKGYPLLKELTFHPVPEAEALNFDRLMIVSDVTQYDQDANDLLRPHRMVLRLGGTIEVLPAEEVARLLAAQTPAPSHEPPPGDGSPPPDPPPNDGGSQSTEKG